jgi:predicted TIM-barrel fold metal-dependent hydrolase
MTRRAFVERSAALLAAVGTAGCVGRGTASDETRDDAGAPPVVDTHEHLWDRKRFHLAWLKGSPTLDRDFLPADYGEATRRLNVVRSVYMEVDVDPDQQVDEADHVIEICRRGGTPMVAAVIGGRPASNGFKSYLSRFKDQSAVKGVRQVLHGPKTPPGYCLDPKFVRGIRLLGDRGLSFDLCVRPSELRDAAGLIDACPDTSFVLDHCGNADVRANDLTSWRSGITEVARRRNVVCKVSGIVASTHGKPWTADDLAPVVNHVLDSFGPDRVVFGGDWPVCTLGGTLRQWVVALRAIVKGRSAADQRKLFHDNAVRVYRLG